MVACAGHLAFALVVWMRRGKSPIAPLLALLPATVKFCALLHKPSRSVRPVEIDYLGFTVVDVFVVGFVLVQAEQYGNLAFVGILAP